jgi:hypothetical protein
MAFEGAKTLIQAVVGRGRKPPILPIIFTCQDSSLTLPQIVFRRKSIMLILQGQAEQQPR